jgi:glutamyl-tRNA synthetase
LPTVRVRFAPSPTGYLHVGGLRTALYNYLFARKQGGIFILRVEDTDRARYVEGAVDNLIRTLHWAGIEFDEGPGKSGSAGPYIQSERLDLYRGYVEQLLQSGNAYYAFDTPEELDDMRKQQERLKQPVKYDRRALRLTAREIEERIASGVPHVVRMKVPDGTSVALDDLIRGRVEFSSDLIDDQVLLKSDGYPTYHLANVVDDHLMGVTHVIRGEEWLSSTPKHLLLYRYFKWDMPQFAHLPLLLNPDKTKLSKRQGDVAVEDYQRKGVLAEALINFVAFLGWNPGDERELFALSELIQEFSLDRVGKSGAVFNLDKLSWYNAQYFRRKPDDDILVMLKEHLAGRETKSGPLSDDYLLLVIGAMRERVTCANDFVENSPYFFFPPEQYDADVVKKRWKPESAAYLQSVADEIKGIVLPTKDAYEAALHRVADARAIKPADVIHPLRLALSGMGTGPGLYDILYILGKDESIRRINAAIEKLR